MAAPNSIPDLPEAEALQTLGLSFADNAEAIRAAFRTCARQANPARHGGCDARLRRLILARDLLMRPEKMAAQALDIKPLYARDAIELRLSLDEALHGGEAKCEIPAFESGYEGVISLTQTVRLRVIVPPGLRDGQSVRLSTREGGLIACRILIETETSVRVWGDDIWMTASLAPHALRLGGPVTIDTPHGAQNLKLPGNIMDGASIRLKGLGLPATESAPAGDLIVRLQASAHTAPSLPRRLEAFRQRWAS